MKAEMKSEMFGLASDTKDFFVQFWLYSFPYFSGNFGLWLDEDLYHGRSHPCATYSNVQLSSQEDFLCSGLEAWTFV